MDWDGSVDTVTASHPGAKVSQMFGAPCDADARAQALELDVAELAPHV